MLMATWITASADLMPGSKHFPILNVERLKLIVQAHYDFVAVALQGSTAAVVQP